MTKLTKTSVEDFDTIKCPVCDFEMEVTMEPYAESPELPTATCSNCDITHLAECLEDNDFRDKARLYHLRLLLEKAAMSKKAIEIIDNIPIFPFSRESTFRSIMEKKIPHPIDFPTNETLKPLKEEDIKDALSVLML